MNSNESLINSIKTEIDINYYDRSFNSLFSEYNSLKKSLSKSEDESFEYTEDIFNNV